MDLIEARQWALEHVLSKFDSLDFTRMMGDDGARGGIENAVNMLVDFIYYGAFKPEKKAEPIEESSFVFALRGAHIPPPWGDERWGLDVRVTVRSVASRLSDIKGHPTDVEDFEYIDLVMWFPNKQAARNWFYQWPQPVPSTSIW